MGPHLYDLDPLGVCMGKAVSAEQLTELLYRKCTDINLNVYFKLKSALHEALLLQLRCVIVNSKLFISAQL